MSTIISGDTGVNKVVDGSIAAVDLATDAVTNVKVADDAVGIAELSATGTAGSGNFLRGDNTWTAVSTDPTMGGDISGTASNAQIVANAVGLPEMASGVDGNIISYDASGNPVAVATGTSGQILTSAGAGAPPTFAAAAAGGGGKILQVKQGVLTTSFSTTSNSYVDLVTIAITPAATSSKILVSFTTNGGTNGDVNHNYMVLHRNTTEIGSATSVSSSTGAMAVANTSAGQQLNYTGSLLDSPNTTSAITYKLKVKTSNSNAAYFNRSARDANNAAYDGRTVSQITVMEVGA